MIAYWCDKQKCDKQKCDKQKCDKQKNIETKKKTSNIVDKSMDEFFEKFCYKKSI
jgi:hypothetical protein